MPPQRGQIVSACVPDPQNRNPKRRPLVIVSATENIKPDEPFLAVAIAGTLPQPLTDEYVELPWHNNKHPRTGLTKRCAAKCDWLEKITEADIEKYQGRVPDTQMLQILEKVKALAPPPPPI